jgi:outer membrane protein OmpA-like peptidoglycan-associated protein
MYRLFIILIFCFSHVCFSQENYKIRFWKQNKNYAVLAEYYSSKYKKQPNNTNFGFKAGINYYFSKEYSQSIQYLSQVISNENDLKHESILQTYYYLGLSLKENNDYYKAKIYFENGFKKSINFKNREFINLFSKEKESIEWAIKNMNTSEKYIQTDFINDSSFNSIISSYYNDSTLILIKNLHIDSVNLNQHLVLKGKNYKQTLLILQNKSFIIGSITPLNQNRFVVSECNKHRKCQLKIYEIQDSVTFNVVALKGKINKDTFNYTMPFCYDQNGLSKIFFCTDDYNGRGKLDIYHADLKHDSLTNIINISYINSIEDDITPFFNIKDSNLYFSSKWINNYGGFDVFKTKYKTNESSKIYNYGKPINSSKNDLHFILNDSIITLVSNRDSSNSCCNKYYQFIPDTNKLIIEKNIKDSISKNQYLSNQDNKYTIEKIDTTINNLTIENKSVENSLDNIKKMKDLFPITLYFHNDEPNPKSWKKNTQYTYEQTYNEYVKLKSIYIDTNRKKNNFIDSAINVFFKNEVNKGFNDFKTLLILLEKELKNNVSVKIYIKGFASPLASNNYNKNLSMRRISTIKNYLKIYNSGILNNYLNKEHQPYIEFITIPYGEEKSNNSVNDNPKNQIKSIYSIEAAKERKIELIGIEIE